jgi:hypothetical protein
MDDTLYDTLSKQYTDIPAQVNYQRPRDIQPIQDNSGYWFGADNDGVSANIDNATVKLDPNKTLDYELHGDTPVGNIAVGVTTPNTGRSTRRVAVTTPANKYAQIRAKRSINPELVRSEIGAQVNPVDAVSIDLAREIAKSKYARDIVDNINVNYKPTDEVNLAVNREVARNKYFKDVTDNIQASYNPRGSNWSGSGGAKLNTTRAPEYNAGVNYDSNDHKLHASVGGQYSPGRNAQEKYWNAMAKLKYKF